MVACQRSISGRSQTIGQAAAEFEDWTGHIRVAVVVAATGAEVGETERLGCLLGVGQVVEVGSATDCNDPGV